MSHREMLKEFYKDRKSIEFEKAIARYTQTELLAETLCPKGKTIAEYFDCDPTLIRIIYAALTIFSLGLPGVLIYFVMAVIMPKSQA